MPVPCGDMTIRWECDCGNAWVKLPVYGAEALS